MSLKLAKIVAHRYMHRSVSRSKTASDDDYAPAQVLPKPCTVVSEVWLRDWPGVGAWQDEYDPAIDNHVDVPSVALELRLRTATGEDHTRLVYIGFPLEAGRYEVLRTAGAKDVEGFPEVGHTLQTVIGWIGKDEYSERAVRLGNIHDPAADSWKSYVDQNVKYRIIHRVAAGTASLPSAITGDMSL